VAKFTWKSSLAVKRYESNPILTNEDMPYPSSMVYNPAVAKFDGRYAMIFRSIFWDEPYSKSSWSLALAYSDDGVTWDVTNRGCTHRIDDSGPGRTIKRTPMDDEFRFEPDVVRLPVDPRLSVVDGRAYLCFKDNTPDGLRGGVAVTDDFKTFEVLSRSAPDNTNMVLFPEKINGNFARLERPFRSKRRNGEEQYDTWYSESPDGRFWGNNRIVLRHGDVGFCNVKNGPCGQPIKTDKGWLTLFHAVHVDPDTEYATWRNEGWHYLYCVGVMMLDLENPARIVGLSRDPLMVPEPPYDYETDGYRSYTLFPCATILEDDGTVRIYYGACDTVVALATAKLDDLIELCKPV